MPRWLPLLVVAAAWLAHGPVIQADWLSEDVVRVRDSAVVDQGLAGIPDAFGVDAWGDEQGASVWRPVALVSFCLEAGVWGRDAGFPAAFGFHLTNLFLHGLASVLVLLLGWRLAPGRPALVAAAALLFAVHPLHAGTVAALAGRADLLALLFSLVTVWLWVEAGRGRPALLPLAALAFFLALLSKESALGLPLLLVALDLGRAGGGTRDAVGQRVAGYAVILVAVLLWALRWPGDLGAAGAKLGLGLEGLGRAVGAFFVPVEFARDRLALTDGLSRVEPSGVALAVGVLVLVGAVIAACTFLARRTRSPLLLAAVALSVMWFVAALVAPVGAPLEARFAYVPGLALVLAGAWLLQPIVVMPSGRPALIGVLGAALLLVGLGALTWREVRVWSDDDSYHQALVDRYPSQDAVLLRTARRYRERAAAELAAWRTRPLHTKEERRKLTRSTMGKLEQAQSYALAAVRRADALDRDDRRSADAHRELGFVLQDLGKPADAVLSLREAARLDALLVRPSGAADASPERKRWLVELYVRLARGEEMIREPEKAADLLQAAAQLAPDDFEVHNAAGRMFIRARLYPEGLRMLRRALELAPDGKNRKRLQRELQQAGQAAAADADRHLREARAAVERGDLREAIAAYKDAITSDPALLRAYEELAFYLGQWFGDYPGAFDWINRAEGVLREMGRPPDDSWWKKFANLEKKLVKMRERDIAEEQGLVPPDEDGDEDGEDR